MHKEDDGLDRICLRQKIVSLRVSKQEVWEVGFMRFYSLCKDCTPDEKNKECPNYLPGKLYTFEVKPSPQ